jgi:acyl-[acyl-carrier-protein] desaturase
MLRQWGVWDLEGLDAEGEQARQELATAVTSLDEEAARFVARREERAAKLAARQEA